MSKNTTTTAADLAAQAAEDGLVTDEKDTKKTVPAQATAETQSEKTDGSDDALVGTKKSLKERLASVTEKLKANKKANKKALLVVSAAAVGMTTVAFVKYAKKQAEMAGDEETLTEDEKKSIEDEMAAGELGG